MKGYQFQQTRTHTYRNPRQRFPLWNPFFLYSSSIPNSKKCGQWTFNKYQQATFMGRGHEKKPTGHWTTLSLREKKPQLLFDPPLLGALGKSFIVAGKRIWPSLPWIDPTVQSFGFGVPTVACGSMVRFLPETPWFQPNLRKSVGWCRRGRFRKRRTRFSPLIDKAWAMCKRRTRVFVGEGGRKGRQAFAQAV